MADEFQPYVGPRPFERADEERFFGRERESSELLSRVIAHPAVLLYSQSGAGKTSLLNASLIPLLEKEGFEILPSARVRGLVPKEIATEGIRNLYVFNVLMSWTGGGAEPQLLAEMSIEVFLNSGQRAISREGMPAPLVAIFDQFEELFTFYPERWSDRQDFFDQVSEALEADRLMRIIFVMREDYIAELDPYVSALPEKLRTRFRLERLREESALEAVTEPLEGTGYSFASGVPEQLVNNLLKVPVETAAGVTTVVGEFVEPVQLQVVCQQLWQKLDHSDTRVITLDQLKAFGDVDRALSDFYETAINNVTHETGVNEGVLRRWFEHTLITPSGTRGTVYRGREETGGIPNAAVDKFVDQHVIRGELRGGARWYELTHDRLIEPIISSNRQWMIERSGAEQTRQRLEARAAEWVRNGRPSSGLLDEAELLEARRWLESPNADDVGYSEALFALVQASRAAIEHSKREQERLLAEEQRRADAAQARAEEQQRHIEEQARSARRLRLLAAALAVMFLLAIGTAAYAVNRSRVATSEARRAQEKERETNAALLEVRKEKRRADEQTATAEQQRSRAESAEVEAKKQAEIAVNRQKEAEHAKALEAAARRKVEENAKAKEILTHQKELAEKQNDAKDAENSALRWEQSGNLEWAIDEFEKATSLYEGLKDSDKEEEMLRHISDLHKQRGEADLAKRHEEYEEAEQASNKGLEIKKRTSGLNSVDLNDQGVFYDEIEKYDKAEELYKQSIAARKLENPREEVVGLAVTYGNLAALYTEKRKYGEAVALCQQALRIQEKILKPDDPSLIRALSSCAYVYREAGRYIEAEPLYQRVLSSYGPTDGSAQPDGKLARSLYNLASLYVNLGKYRDAEPLLKQATDIQDALLYKRPDPPEFRPLNLMATLDEQGIVYYYEGKYANAEVFYQKALDIDLKGDAPQSEVATMLNNLALAYVKQARFEKAEQNAKQSLEIREKLGGLALERISFNHSVLARIYSAQAKYVEAEALFNRVIEERERALGANHPDIAIDRHYLADFYVSRGKYELAREIEQKAIPVLEQSLGSTNWRTSAALSTMATIDVAQGKYAEAEKLYHKAITNLQGTFGNEHPEIAISLNGLGRLYITQGRYAEAKECLDGAQEIQKHMLGAEHPDLASTLNNYGLLYSKQGKYVEAESFYKQALAIREKVFGSEHPSVAETLKNYAALLRATKRDAEATAMEARAKAIRAKYPQLGPDN